MSADSGHIALHECGAVERCGHKVLPLPHTDGKISANTLEEYLSNFHSDGNKSFMVEPGMLYVSQPTEYGTIYSKQELENLYKVCKKYGVISYIDGARLGYALACNEADFTLQDIANCCDVFYFGGTKIGALVGEALVIKGETPTAIYSLIKQHGAQLAKGRAIGVQFDALFTDNYWYKICKNAIDKAQKLKLILKEKGYKFFLETPTNQQFIILENNQLLKLSEKVKTAFWEKFDDTHTVVRFATSWATTDDDLENLKNTL
jgi:threonine aldolase